MSDRSLLARRGRRLEYFTIGWNSIEGLMAVGAGAAARRVPRARRAVSGLQCRRRAARSAGLRAVLHAARRSHSLG